MSGIAASAAQAERARNSTTVVSRAADPYAEHIADASRRFSIPAAWYSRRHARRKHQQSARAVAEADADHAGDVAGTARPPRLGHLLMIRATTSWRAQPICARCTTASARLASSPPIMRGRSAMRSILPLARRFRRRRFRYRRPLQRRIRPGRCRRKGPNPLQR